MKNAKERCENEKQQHNSNSASLDSFFLRSLSAEGPVVGQWKATSKQGDGITLGKNLGVKECICDSNGSKQKSEMKDVLSQVTMNYTIKN